MRAYVFHGTVTTTPVSQRAGAGVALPCSVPVPFGDPGHDDERAVARLVRSLDAVVEDGPPAAVVIGSVRGEAGVHPASAAWLRALASWARAPGTLLGWTTCPSPSAGTGCRWPSR